MLLGVAGNRIGGSVRHGRSYEQHRVRNLGSYNGLMKCTLNVSGNVGPRLLKPQVFWRYRECGVFKGVGAMYWAKLLAIYAPGSSKRAVGFDTFSKFANSMLTTVGGR